MLVSEAVHPCEVHVKQFVSSLRTKTIEKVCNPGLGLAGGLLISMLAGAPMPLPQVALAGPWLAACAAGALGARSAAAVGFVSYLLFGHPGLVAGVGAAVIAVLVAWAVPASMAPIRSEPMEDEDRGNASALVVDCEGFASLDDVYGQGASDHVFRMLHRALKVETRNTDLVVQTREQELVLVLDGSRPEVARKVMQRVEQRFAGWLSDAGYECNLSVGLTDIRENQAEFDSVMRSTRRANGHGYLD